MLLVYYYVWEVGVLPSFFPLLSLLSSSYSTPSVPALPTPTQAFSSLAESAYELACTDEDTEPATYSLSGAFEFLVTKVMQTADR